MYELRFVFNKILYSITFNDYYLYACVKNEMTNSVLNIEQEYVMEQSACIQSLGYETLGGRNVFRCNFSPYIETFDVLYQSMLREEKSYEAIRLYIIFLIHKNMDINNSIFIHGTTIRYQDKGICFVGEKNTGKSTLSGILLMRENACLVNDDVSIISLNETCIVHGVFKGINFHNETLFTVRRGYCVETEKEAGDLKYRLICPDFKSAAESTLNYVVVLNDETAGHSYSKLQKYCFFEEDAACNKTIEEIQNSGVKIINLETQMNPYQTIEKLMNYIQ